MVKQAYEEYPTSLEEDYEILKREDLTFNQRNSVLFRSGEKEILSFFMRTLPKFLDLFEMDLKTARKEAQGLKDY